MVNTSEVATLAGPPGPRRGRALRDVRLIPRGAVAIRDGLVLAVGRGSKIRQRYRAARVVDAEGGLVTPGFVDPHTHLPFAGHRSFELRYKLAGRSYESILRAGGGIHRTIRDTQRVAFPDLVGQMKGRLQAMFEWGTTTAEAKSGYGLEWRHEEKQLRAVRAASSGRGVELVPTFLGAHVLPPKPKGGRRAWVETIASEMVPQAARDRLAEFVDVFVERSAYTRDESRRILEAARIHGLGLKLHADEFSDQRGAELGVGLGAQSCDHLLRVSRRGIRALGRSSTIEIGRAHV